RPASTASPRAPNVHSSPQSLPASTAPSTLRSKPATAAAVLRQLPPCPTSAFWIDQAHTRRLSPLAAELSVVGLGRTYGGHARPGRRSHRHGGRIAFAEGLLRSPGHRSPRAAAGDPVPALPHDPLLRPEQREDAGQGPGPGTE